MPALVNIRVGSLRGTSGDDGTISWPFLAKKSRKLDRISLTPLIRSYPRLSLLLAAPPVPVQEGYHVSAPSPALPSGHRGVSAPVPPLRQAAMPLPLRHRSTI